MFLRIFIYTTIYIVIFIIILTVGLKVYGYRKKLFGKRQDYSYHYRKKLAVNNTNISQEQDAKIGDDI